MVFYLGLVFLLLILVFRSFGRHLDNTRRGHRYSGQRPSCSGSCPLGWGTALATHDVAKFPRVCLFISLV